MILLTYFAAFAIVMDNGHLPLYRVDAKGPVPIVSSFLYTVISFPLNWGIHSLARLVMLILKTLTTGAGLNPIILRHKRI